MEVSSLSEKYSFAIKFYKLNRNKKALFQGFSKRKNLFFILKMKQKAGIASCNRLFFKAFYKTN